jgi:hypothetical protein
VFEEAACFADDDPKSKLDRLKMRVDPLAANCFQGTEQPIAPLMISLTFGHSKFVQTLTCFRARVRPAEVRRPQRSAFGREFWWSYARNLCT